MNDEIRKRIETVRRGEVPEGYQQEEGYVIPGDWHLEAFSKKFRRSLRRNASACNNVLTISAQFGLVSQKEYYDKDIASEDKSGYFLLRRGEFAYNKSYSSGYPYGAIKRLEKHEEGIVSPLYICFEPKQETNADFYAHYFEAGLYNREIYRFAQEGARNHGLLNISTEDFFEGALIVPPEEEQQKIADILATCDRVIELKQKRVEELKQLKKTCLAKMFPQEGENVPELRSPGFTGSWEQRKLLDCIQKITDFRGRTPKKLGMEWRETGYLALSALNVKDGYIDFSQDVHYGDQALYDKWMTGNELHKGQVLFTTEAPMGNVAQVPDNRRYILSQRTIAFAAKLDLITENFLATVLRTPTVFSSLTTLSSGGTAKGVSQKSLARVDITIPSNLEEQEQLASMFAGIDTLINLHQRELEAEQQKEKALMQLLLTGLVRV